MPITPLAATALQSLGGVQGGLLNQVSAMGNNIIQDKINQRNYNQQKRDNLEFWAMQNEYNSPQQQMQRFKDAGLNPNLIYGQGSAGNASPIQTADIKPTNVTDPRQGQQNTFNLSELYDLEIKAATVDNLRAQNTVIQQDALLKKALTQNTLTGEERRRFDLDFEGELRGVSADTRKEKLRQLKTTTDISINEDARRALLTNKTLEKAAEEMLNLREQRLNMRTERGRTQADTLRLKIETDRLRQTIENLKKDGTLKDLDLQLRKDGINPNDPMWARFLGRYLSNLLDENPAGGGSIWNFFTK